MLSVALGLFALAAAGGVIMVVLRVRNDRNPPLSIALLHGGLAATALGLLLWQVANRAASGALPFAAATLFVIAALGGFVLFATHLGGRTLPLGVVALHAIAAVAAFLILALAVLG